MKRIFLALALICSTAAFCADKSNKKAKVVTAPAVTAVVNDPSIPVPGHSGFDYIPDEAALEIPLQFAHKNSFDLESVRDLAHLSGVSKRFNILVKDTQVARQLYPLTAALINPNWILTLDREKKLSFLFDVDKDSSDEMKTIACKQLARAINNSQSRLSGLGLKYQLNPQNKPIIPIIEGAIQRSNLELFKEAQRMLKLHFGSALGSAAISPEQEKLKRLAYQAASPNCPADKKAEAKAILAIVDPQSISIPVR